MVSREQDRAVFRELFDAWFRDPELANKLLAQMLPQRRRQGRARQAPAARERGAGAAARPAGRPPQTERRRSTSTPP